MQFRQAGPQNREMDVQVNQEELREADKGKITEAVELFGDSSQLESIQLAKAALRAELESVGAVQVPITWRLRRILVEHNYEKCCLCT